MSQWNPTPRGNDTSKEFVKIDPTPGRLLYHSSHDFLNFVFRFGAKERKQQIIGNGSHNRGKVWLCYFIRPNYRFSGKRGSEDGCDGKSNWHQFGPNSRAQEERRSPSIPMSDFCFLYRVLLFQGSVHFLVYLAKCAGKCLFDIELRNLPWQRLDASRVALEIASETWYKLPERCEIESIVAEKNVVRLLSDRELLRKLKTRAGRYPITIKQLKSGLFSVVRATQTRHRKYGALQWTLFRLESGTKWQNWIREKQLNQQWVLLWRLIVMQKVNLNFDCEFVEILYFTMSSLFDLMDVYSCLF